MMETTVIMKRILEGYKKQKKRTSEYYRSEKKTGMKGEQKQS